MPNRFNDPNIQFCDASGLPYAGGTLSFYAAGTATPLATYSDSGLSVPNTNPVVLDSAGRAGSIFLQNLAYKVVLADSNAVQIWTEDPVSTSDYTTDAQFRTFAGNPNGSVAGTAGSGSVDSSVIWDRTNNILYVCTTTGSASTAVWTAVNASSQAVTPQPQGRLTPTTGTPVIAVDATSVTSIFYTPYLGNLVPVYNGATFSLLTFAELTLTLASQHTSNTLYDVFAFSNSGTATLCTGPAWSVAGNYVSAGSLTTGVAARGTGAGTTQLSRVLGLWTNTVSMTGRNGASTFAIGANQATYLGTIWIDASAGQVSCLLGYGQNRKFGVWNAYNRVPVALSCGDGTASWSYSTATARPANNATANSLTVLNGLPEEIAEVFYEQFMSAGTAGAGAASNGVGVASTTVISGRKGSFQANATASSGSTCRATYLAEPALGLAAFTAMELGPGFAITWNGTSANMELRATWQG